MLHGLGHDRVEFPIILDLGVDAEGQGPAGATKRTARLPNTSRKVRTGRGGSRVSTSGGTAARPLTG